jgi:mono/diheme cytochrome c family protein
LNGTAISAATIFQQRNQAMRWLRSISLSAAVAVLVTSAQAAQVGSAEQGHQLAREKCAECHLLGLETGKSTNAAAPTFKEIAETPGMTGAALRASLQSWHKDMPNLILAGEEADSLIAYILSLSPSAR